MKLHRQTVLLEHNPTREERLLALLEGKIIEKTTYRKENGREEFRIQYFKMNKHTGLSFSYKNHPSSFHPYHNMFDFSDVLEDIDHNKDECYYIILK